MIVAVPPVKVVARPVVLTVATVLSDELHAAELVTFFVLPSLYLPVAEYCSVSPAMTDAWLGLRLIDCNEGVGGSVELGDEPPPQAIIVARRNKIVESKMRNCTFILGPPPNYSCDLVTTGRKAPRLG